MSAIKRKVGETICITGGAETTPRITVKTYSCPGSMHHGDKIFVIQDTETGEMVGLSPDTMQEILKCAPVFYRS